MQRIDIDRKRGEIEIRESNPGVASHP
jgi:hypothetical protein